MFAGGGSVGSLLVGMRCRFRYAKISRLVICIKSLICSSSLADIAAVRPCLNKYIFNTSWSLVPLKDTLWCLRTARSCATDMWLIAEVVVGIDVILPE